MVYFNAINPCANQYIQEIKIKIYSVNTTFVFFLSGEIDQVWAFYNGIRNKCVNVCRPPLLP